MSPPARAPDGLLAAALTVALTAVYLANGTIAPTHDASASVWLAANVVRDGRLSFTPSRDPLLFTWQLKAGPGDRPVGVRVPSLDAVLAGAPARTAYAEKRLVATPNYALVPGTRVDPSSGETLYVNLYGPGAGLVAAPAMALVRLTGHDLRDPWWVWYAAKLVASLCAAGSVAFVYLSLRRFLALRAALAVSVAYGLGTSLWSMTSQTLWQHGPNTFFIAAGTWLLLRAWRDAPPRGLALAGAAFAAATVCRPTSVLFVAAVGGYLLLSNRRAALAFLAGAAPLGLMLAAYNWYYLGSPLRSGQATYAGSLLFGSLPEVLAGLLVSPSRGLFVFSPFLLLAIPGVVAVWRDERYAALRPISLGAAAVLLLHGAWPVWWGGWGYGYRMIGDLAATLILLVVPMVPWVAARRARLVAAGVACAWAAGLQAIGAFAYDTDWHNPTVFAIQARPNGRFFMTSEEAMRAARAAGLDRIYSGPISIDQYQGPLWSIGASQPLTYATHLSASRQRQLAQTEWWLGLWR